MLVSVTSHCLSLILRRRHYTTYDQSLRQLHLQYTKQQKYHQCIKTIEQMHRLPDMRVGATEAAAHLHALYRVGKYRQAIDIWHQYMGRKDIRHLFGQTHCYALRSAVALKLPQPVKQIYVGAMERVRKSEIKVLPALYWGILQKVTAVGGDLPSSGRERPWDPGRLGSDFIGRLLSDYSTIPEDRLLESKIQQIHIRALCLEGQWQTAHRMYQEYIENTLQRQWVLGELVLGLCTHRQYDLAYQLLNNFPEQTTYLWNIYLNGLSHSHQPASHDRIQQIIDNRINQPDLVTRTICLRSCFRFGHTSQGLRYFHRHFSEMCRDPVCWDILLRGLLSHADTKQQGLKWTNKLIDLGLSDGRLVETVIKYLLVDSQMADGKIAQWVEDKMDVDRKSLFSIIIDGLFKKQQPDLALQIYRQMGFSRHLWPTRSINCIVVGHLGFSEALQFISQHCPPQHQPAALLVLLQRCLQQNQWDQAWKLLKDPRASKYMFKTALQWTLSEKNWSQYRRLLDFIKC